MCLCVRVCVCKYFISLFFTLSWPPKARLLEQKNKQVVEQLDELRRNWVTETMKVKEEFSHQLNRHRKALEVAEMSKVRIQVQAASLDERYNSLQAEYVLCAHARYTIKCMECFLRQ